MRRRLTTTVCATDEGAPGLRQDEDFKSDAASGGPWEAADAGAR